MDPVVVSGATVVVIGAAFVVVVVVVVGAITVVVGSADVVWSVSAVVIVSKITHTYTYRQTDTHNDITKKVCSVG